MIILHLLMYSLHQATFLSSLKSGLVSAVDGILILTGGCSGVVVEYRTRNREVAGSTHSRSTANNIEQVANLLCAQANSASYPQRDGK